MVFPQSDRSRPEKRPFFHIFPHFSKIEPLTQAAFHVGPGWAPVGQSWAPNGPRMGLTGAQLGMLLGKKVFTAYRSPIYQIKAAEMLSQMKII